MIHREGLIAKRSMEIPLEAINDVRFEQGIFDRIVGAGTLVISSASEFGTQLLRRHPPPRRGPEDDLPPGRDEQEADVPGGPLGAPRRSGAAPPVAPAAPPVAPSTTTELERLAKLRADGVLTEEEFQAQKAKILGQG